MKHVLSSGKAKPQATRGGRARRLVGVAAVLAFASTHATEADVMDLLLCLHGSASAYERMYQALESLKPVLVEQGDGHFKLPGVFRRGDACVSDAEVVGAFGVLVVKGVICNGSDWRALVRQASEASPTLKPPAQAEVGEPLASLSDGVSQLSVWRGSSPFWPFPSSPTLDSDRLIYVCSLRSSKARGAP